MLDAAGVRDLELKIIWESGEFAGDTQVMEAVYQMLGAVGVRTTLQQFEPGGDISNWRQGRAGDWDLVANGYPSPTGLAVTIMQGMYAGTPKKEETRDTYHGYIVPEVTELIGQASSGVVLVRLAPGDPARTYAGPTATTEQVEAVRRQFGLDQPLIVQYWTFVKGLFQGDLGTSFSYQNSALDVVLNRLPYTTTLATSAILVT